MSSLWNRKNILNVIFTTLLSSLYVMPTLAGPNGIPSKAEFEGVLPATIRYNKLNLAKIPPCLIAFWGFECFDGFGDENWEVKAEKEEEVLAKLSLYEDNQGHFFVRLTADAIDDCPPLRVLYSATPTGDSTFSLVPRNGLNNKGTLFITGDEAVLKLGFNNYGEINEGPIYNASCEWIVKTHGIPLKFKSTNAQ